MCSKTSIFMFVKIWNKSHKFHQCVLWVFTMGWRCIYRHKDNLSLAEPTVFILSYTWRRRRLHSPSCSLLLNCTWPHSSGSLFDDLLWLSPNGNEAIWKSATETSHFHLLIGVRILSKVALTSEFNTTEEPGGRTQLYSDLIGKEG